MYKYSLPRRNKYNNKPVSAAGMKYASKKEAKRGVELRILEKAGLITDLQYQVRFQIVPKVGKERARFYVADFTYIENGKKTIEDVKSPITRVNTTYRLKRALILWQYPDYVFKET